MRQHITTDGEMLDAICYREYGRTAGVTEAVLKHNRGLADLGEVYDAGVVIELPAFAKPTAQTKRPVRLYG